MTGCGFVSVCRSVLLSPSTGVKLQAADHSCGRLRVRQHVSRPRGRAHVSSTRAWRAATGDESERADYRAEVVWDVASALQPASAGPVHVQTEGLPVRKPDQCDSTIRFGRSVRLEALKPISRLLSSRNALRILMVDSPRHYIFVITLVCSALKRHGC